MKKLLLSFLFLPFTFIVNAQNTKPSTKETYDYIQNLLDDANGYTISYTNGSVDKISLSYYNYRSNIKDRDYFYGGEASTKDLGCDDRNYYSNIDFSKLNGEPSGYAEDRISSSSSLKKLQLTFTANSVLYELAGTCPNKHAQQPTSTVIFVYRNEEGVKERLIKAILYLSKLRKEEEKAKSDPFVN